MKSSFGHIRNPFSSFDKKTKLGALKTNCVGCEGCKCEYWGHTAYPCNVCSHNLRNKESVNVRNYYEKR